MPKVEIYTKTTCPFCVAAMDLLAKKNVAFEETSLNKEPQARDTMIKRAMGGSTVPQIFIDGTHIGGCDDLFELESKGALDALLAG